MLASKEPVEKKEYSALKNPVAAIIQLALEVPVLLLGSKAIEKAANKGLFDKGKRDSITKNFIKTLLQARCKMPLKKAPKALKERMNL